MGSRRENGREEKKKGGGREEKGKLGIEEGRKERKERESYTKNIIINWNNNDLTVEHF